MSLFGDIFSGVAGLFGSNADRNAQKDANADNLAWQEQFAKHGLSWRAQDARDAGINPLAAIGGATFTPSFSVGDSGSNAGNWARAGQNLARAIDATRTQEDRDSAKLSSLQVERASLENDLLRSQIAQLSANPNPPFPSANNSNPIPGQVQSGVEVTTSQTPAAAAHAGLGGYEAGAIPAVTYMRSPSGGLIPGMSRALQQGGDDIFEPATLEWYWRNRISNWYTGLPAPSTKDYVPPEAEKYKGLKSEWVWNPWHQQFEARYHN